MTKKSKSQERKVDEGLVKAKRIYVPTLPPIGEPVGTKIAILE